MSQTIKKLTIRGYKSIRELNDFELKPLNVLIGANGAGKSNFLGFFDLLRHVAKKRLNFFLNWNGGSNSCLFMGPQITRAIEAEVQLNNFWYQFRVVPTVDNQFLFDSETERHNKMPARLLDFGSGHYESRAVEVVDCERELDLTYTSLTFSGWLRWSKYHFVDTGSLALVRGKQAVHDNAYLFSDASNLAAILYRIQKTNQSSYNAIRSVLRLAAPYFHDFHLRPAPINPEQIQLEWTQLKSDHIFGPHQLSDGTLRFICLATALLQPDPPAVSVFDEPELGLHPIAITLLAELIRQAASENRQIIVATQSVSLLSEFEPEDVITVDREDGQSTFHRLDSRDLSEWTNDYTLGELWEKNVLGAGPKPDSRPRP